MAEDEVARVWSLIENISVAMVVTHAGVQAMRARPMAARAGRTDNVIYFLTDAGAVKDDEIRRDGNVCLAFVAASKQKYLSVTGRAEILNDRAKIKQNWSVFDKAFWSDADDPAIRLLKVQPEQAEYWERAGAVATTIKMIAAQVTGGRPSLGSNEKVDLGGLRRSNSS
jgi:general stress protein 26